MKIAARWIGLDGYQQGMTRAGQPGAREIPQEVVAAAIAGDASAQAELYARIRPLIAGTLRLLTGGAGAPEDLCADMAVEVFATLDRFRWRSAFSTWVHAIVVRRFHAVRRNERVRRRAAARGEPAPRVTPLPLPEDLAATHEVVAAALEVVADLPPRMQQCFLMLDIERFEAGEIARQLGTSVGAVQDCAYRARVRIRERLRERGLLEAVGTDPVRDDGVDAGNVVKLPPHKRNVEHG